MRDKVLDKIDSYLHKMESNKPKNDDKVDQIPFLFATEDLEGFGLTTKVKGRLEEARKIGGKDYDAFFKSMLKKWKIKSYKDLPKDKQKKFFDEVDKGWEAKKETD